jgi:hypothetical protein
MGRFGGFWIGFSSISKVARCLFNKIGELARDLILRPVYRMVIRDMNLLHPFVVTE